MPKRKLILYSPEERNCEHHKKIFSSLYGIHIHTTKTEAEFLNSTRTLAADAALICFCSAREEDVENVLRLDALAGPLPVLTCSKTLNPEFVRKAAQRGAGRFLVCNMTSEKIRELIRDAIRDHGLREYLESRWPGALETSRHVDKLISEIVHIFPYRMKVEEYAERINIDRGWLYKLCEETFGISPTALLRLIWVHQALSMMQHTKLDNMDIALQLDYSEESSMAREFRKELGYSPNKARKWLIEKKPEELLG